MQPKTGFSVLKKTRLPDFSVLAKTGLESPNLNEDCLSVGLSVTLNGDRNRNHCTQRPEILYRETILLNSRKRQKLGHNDLLE